MWSVNSTPSSSLSHIVVNSNDLAAVYSDVSVSGQLVGSLGVSVYNVSTLACLSRGISVVDLYEVNVPIQLQRSRLAIRVSGRIQEVYQTLVLILNAGDSYTLDRAVVIPSPEIALTPLILSPSTVYWIS